MAELTRAEIKQDMQEVAERVVEQVVERTVSQVVGVIHDLMEIMSQKFEKVDARLDRVDEQLTAIQQQNNRTQDIIKGIHNRLNDHGGRIVTLEKRVRRITQP